MKNNFNIDLNRIVGKICDITKTNQVPHNTEQI